MPEKVPMPTTSERHDAALKALEDVMAGWGAERLATHLLAPYAERNITHAWRFQFKFSDAERRLDLLIDTNFPRSPIRIALVDRPPFQTWAHVEKDGVLCILNGAASVNPHAPGDVAAALLDEAVVLIEDLIAGRRAQDFKDEFLSYWNWSETKDATRVLSLLQPSGPSRSVRVWRGQRFYLLAETDAQLQHWLTGALNNPAKNTFRFEQAALLWRDEPLAPAEYPKSGLDLASLAGPAEAQMLATITLQTPERLVTAIGARSAHGACFGAVILSAPTSKILEAGFRPGHVPAELTVTRYNGHAKVARSSVERVDGAWIHGRDKDPRQVILSKATVTILGCGSVGAPLAVMLAQAGAGRLRLVDNDVLKSANIGRHPLGVSDLGQFKAIALAKLIRQRFPHVEVEAVSRRWETLDADFGLFRNSDLIISAMGDWEAEGALNMAHLAEGRRKPILYGWTEAHASAGHAVLIGHAGGCFQCGMDTHGAPLFPVTNWSPAAQLQQEPACGAVYQPYGPSELAYIVSLISELALDSLLGAAVGSEHRIWATSQRRLEAINGGWSEVFKAETNNRPSFGFIHERQWLSRSTCPECRSQALAA